MVGFILYRQQPGQAEMRPILSDSISEKVGEVLQPGKDSQEKIIPCILNRATGGLIVLQHQDVVSFQTEKGDQHRIFTKVGENDFVWVKYGGPANPDNKIIKVDKNIPGWDGDTGKFADAEAITKKPKKGSDLSPTSPSPANADIAEPAGPILVAKGSRSKTVGVGASIVELVKNVPGAALKMGKDLLADTLYVLSGMTERKEGEKAGTFLGRAGLKLAPLVAGLGAGVAGPQAAFLAAASTKVAVIAVTPQEEKKPLPPATGSGTADAQTPEKKGPTAWQRLVRSGKTCAAVAAIYLGLTVGTGSAKQPPPPPRPVPTPKVPQGPVPTPIVPQRPVSTPSIPTSGIPVINILLGVFAGGVIGREAREKVEKQRQVGGNETVHEK